jgi:predicted nuclease of predicted toxin-antitoxin system
MALRYLLDENVDVRYRSQLLRYAPALIVKVVHDPDVPPKETTDPQIVQWCEAHEFILVTNNRRSMPRHLADHLANGGHVPGIFVLDPEMSMGETIEELILISEASFTDEYRDRIIYLPIT